MSTAKKMRGQRLQWPDFVKGVALVGIVLVHIVERVFGAPEFGNPWMGWAPFGDRLAQLSPLSGLGFLDLPLNLLRYTGWMGDNAVQLFLIVSGFGLVWGLLRSGKGGPPLNIMSFYRSRAIRIYPMWITAHLLLLVFAAITGLVTFSGTSFVASLLGIRFLPGTFYALAPAWWFIGLLLQLYAVFPALWWLLQRWGPTRFLLVIGISAFLIRGVGLLLFSGEVYLDPWSRGAFFVTRLPEFIFGMALAAWMFRDPQGVDNLLRSRPAAALAMSSLIVGIGLSLTLAGMTVALFLMGLGLFVLTYALLPILQNVIPRIVGRIDWIGRHSLSLYLTHQTFVNTLVPQNALVPYAEGLGSLPYVLLTTGFAVGLAIVSALLLEWLVTGLPRAIRGWIARAGGLRVASAFAVTGIAVGALLVASDLAIGRYDPQEILGWGERRSLQPDRVFGWRLIPSTETRLRWVNYDYVVSTSNLGFPGPEYASTRPPGGLRILTIGDAFTSAEGVDTERSWPRLLEGALTEQLKPRPVEVLNFAITGYGPNQYAAVADAVVPRYNPDVIAIGFFVNDFDDAQLSDDDFRSSIGFALRSQDGWLTVLTLQQLRQWLRIHLTRLIEEHLQGRPSSDGYFLGNFKALERSSSDDTVDVEQRLSSIRANADLVGARVILMAIPASVQVCSREALEYYPAHVDLNDAQRFDLDRPQRLAVQMAKKLDITFLDLRAVLKRQTHCPYQARNMHFTERGHEAVAKLLAAHLADYELSAEQEITR